MTVPLDEFLVELGADLIRSSQTVDDVEQQLTEIGHAAGVERFDGCYEGENPIRLLIPPLLIFLPGAKITTGTIELAQGSIVSGSSRLVSGLIVLAVALGAERLAAEFVSPSVSAFFGAMAMTPIVLAVDRRPAGPRAMVLFLPGFYLLVPGRRA